MAVKNKEMDSMTFAVPKKEVKHVIPTVTVVIPELPGAGGDMKVDQYEHVTIANEVSEQHWKILRGSQVDVPWPVYEQLKNRYPNI